MTKKLNIPFSPPDITEEEIQAVAEVMRSGWITTGPKTKQFEKEIAAYCHTQKAVCMNSATACLEMTLRLFGIGEGDEVIVPAYTYTASASVVCHVGATLKLVDCAPGSFHLDYDALEQAVTEKTKAIIPVDIAGVMVDYPRIYYTKGVCFVNYSSVSEQPSHDAQSASHSSSSSLLKSSEKSNSRFSPQLGHSISPSRRTSSETLSF